MKIRITEEQVKKLMEAELYYGDEKLPELIRDIQKDISEAKKIGGNFFNMLKTLDISILMLGNGNTSGLINKMEEIHKTVYKKTMKYFNILETFENDFNNEPLQQFDSLVTTYDTMQSDIENIIYNYKEIVEIFLDGDEIKNKFQYYEKEYPTQTININ